MIKSIFLSLLICTGCITNNSKQKYQISKEEQLINSILGKSARIIKDKYNLRPCGAGAAMPGGPIQELTLCFDTKYPHTKEELRELIIKTSQELLNQVTENKEIQKFIKNPPYNKKHTNYNL